MVGAQVCWERKAMLGNIESDLSAGGEVKEAVGFQI